MPNAGSFRPKLSFELPQRCSVLKGWILFAKKPPGNDVTGRGHHLESAGSIQISVTELIGVDKSTKLLDNSWVGKLCHGHKLIISWRLERFSVVEIFLEIFCGRNFFGNKFFFLAWSKICKINFMVVAIRIYVARIGNF